MALYSGGELSTASAVFLTPVNGPGGFPDLGFVVGPASSNDDLGAGSPNYDLLTEANFTALGAGPTASGNAYSGANDETTVFLVDSSGNITVQWINTNLSSPATSLVYLAGSDGLLITGDFTAFNAAFPGGILTKWLYVPLNATTGNIQVFNASTNASVGYVSNSYTNSTTHRFGITATSANALIIDDPISAATPEPGSIALLTAGLGALWVVRKRPVR